MVVMSFVSPQLLGVSRDVVTGRMEGLRLRYHTIQYRVMIYNKLNMTWHRSLDKKHRGVEGAGFAVKGGRERLQLFLPGLHSPTLHDMDRLYNSDPPLLGP